MKLNNKICAKRNSVCTGNVCNVSGITKKIISLLLICICFISGCRISEEKQTVKPDIRDFETVDCIVSTNPEYADFLDNVNNYYEKCGFNGCVLVAQGDEIILAKGYGKSDLKNDDSEPITIHSTFEAGSITKQFTAAAILLLEEEGKLSTDDKLSKYYKDYQYGDIITIDMLLHMRSGLADHIDDPFGFYPEEVAEEVWNAELEGKTLPKDITISYFEDVPLQFKPNERFIYCNLNYRLLADIVEKVSGQDFDDYIQDNIFDVVGMQESNLNFQETSTVGYDAAGLYYSIPKATALGAGDLNTTVLDLYLWDQSLLNDCVLSEEQTNKLVKPDGEYACGVFVSRDTILHGGSTDVFNAYNIIYRNDGMIIVVLINKPISESSSTAIANSTRKIWINTMEEKR